MESFSACVEAAFHRTKALLLPINKVIWLKLFFLLCLSGGCTSFSGIGDFTRLTSFKENKTLSAPAPTPPPADFTSQPLTDTQRDIERLSVVVKTVSEKGRLIWGKIRPYLYLVLATLFALWLLVTIFFTWISSRLQMVLVTSLAEGDVSVRRLWRETRAHGQSFFLFNLTMFIVFFVMFAVPLGASAWGLYHAFKTASLSTGVVSGAVMVLFIFLFIMAASMVWFFVRFVPVVMVQNNQSAGAAAYTLWAWVKNNMWRVTVDLFLYSLIALAVGIMFAVASAIVTIAVALIVAPMGVALAFVVKNTAAKWTLIVFSVLIGLVYVLVLSVINTVPMGTFLTYLRMELMMRGLSRTPQSSIHAEA